MSVITPAPTVSPPSRMAKLGPLPNTTGTPRPTPPPPPLHLVPVDPPQQQTGVVPRLPLVQGLVEHLHPGHHRALALLPQPHDLHRFPGLHHPPVSPPRHHRPSPLDREHA